MTSLPNPFMNPAESPAGSASVSDAPPVSGGGCRQIQTAAADFVAVERELLVGILAHLQDQIWPPDRSPLPEFIETFSINELMRKTA
jgi:hypothetical protein